MASFLGWVDYDAREQARIQRILALFGSQEPRQELGLGSIRDSVADLLFPGTSTVQTRLRYFLFVPWIYRDLEKRRVPASRFAAEVSKAEGRLIDILRRGDDVVGVFGRRAGRGVQRLPSAAYWAGLGAWGIRQCTLSQQSYHLRIHALYRALDQRLAHETYDEAPEPGFHTWHRGLPEPPEGFPETATIELRPEEARFLIDRIRATHQGSLLAWLVVRAAEPQAEVEYAWQHPHLAQFPDNVRLLVDQARLLSDLMHGAALLYNLMLAELAEIAETRRRYLRELKEWERDLDRRELRQWDLERFWADAAHPNHFVSWRTREFVGQWRALVLNSRSPSKDEHCRDLVRHREEYLKGPRSRFRNKQALDSWRGSSGVHRLDFRWHVVQRYLLELHRALNGGD